MEIKKLLLQRIGLSPDEPVTLDHLTAILEAYAFHVPFENIDVIEDKRMSLSRENLADKILIRNRGGLCYEMNPLMYWFLLEAGIDATLIKATVYNNEANTWALHHTHVTILIKDQNGDEFLADAGFGARAPLKLIPFSGEEVHSSAGNYRIRQRQTEEGTHLLEMKNNKGEWIPAYAFHPAEELQDSLDLEAIQQVIHEHEMSPFNKTMLIAMRTPEGKMVLTSDSFLKETDGVIEKRLLEAGQSSSLLKEHFGITKR